MAFDGIVTKTVTTELKNIIGYKIDKIYEPDRNTILLGLYGKNQNLALVLCISSNNCRLHLTTNFQKNPTIAPNFCMLLRKHLIGYKIKDIYTVDLERIVFIDLENNENPNKPIFKKLIIELMGKHSNIILVNENDLIIDSMRHTSIEENSSRDIYPTSKYIFPKSQKLSFLKLNDFDEFYSIFTKYLNDESSSSVDSISKIISNNFNGISLSFIQNIVKELNITDISKESLNLIWNKINEILSYKNNLDIVINDKDYYLYTSKSASSESFHINFVLDDFYSKKETTELFKNYKNSILNLILATLKKYEKRLVNIDNKLEECKDKDTFRLYGELITSNLYKLPNQNLEKIELENYYNNNELITIPLDKKYSPSYNAKRYFKKYTKLKNALEIVNKQKQETIADINYIESVIYELGTCKTVQDIEIVYEEILESSIFADKLKDNKQKKKPKKSKPLTKNKMVTFNPRKYTIDGYTVLVGRNNKENDYLTFKFANKNDIWFHTKDIHGSHVILKVVPNERVSEEILFEVAKIAVKHSKGASSSNVPVDYCKVSFVKKPNGSKPGFVIYSNNKTLYV